MIELRRRYNGGESDNSSIPSWTTPTLPSEYQRIDCLKKNDALSYIKLGINIKGGKLYSTRASFSFSGSFVGNYNAAIDGYYGTVPHLGYPQYSSVVFIRNGETVGSVADVTLKSMEVDYGNQIANKRHFVEFNTPEGSFMDNIKYSNDYLISETSYTTENSFFLFLRGASDGTIKAEHFLGEIERYTLYEDCIAIRDMIPCYRKSDDVAGMYDLVSGEFYTNAGTGKFDVGPDVIG